MDRTLRNELLDIAAEAGIGADAYEGYSGKGMLGTRTAAIEIDRISDAYLLADMYEDNNPGKRVIVRTDSLGKGFVMY